MKHFLIYSVLILAILFNYQTDGQAVPNEHAAWENQRNSLLQKMESRLAEVQSKLVSKPPVDTAPPDHLTWTERREKILAKMRARQADIDAQIQLSKEIVAEKRRVASENSVNTQPLVAETIPIVNEVSAGSHNVIETPNIGAVRTQTVGPVDGTGVPFGTVGDTANSVGPGSIGTTLEPTSGPGILVGPGSGINAGDTGTPLGPDAGAGIPLGPTNVPVNTGNSQEAGIPLGPVGGIPLGPDEGIPLGPGGGVPLGPGGGIPLGPGGGIPLGPGDGIPLGQIKDVDLSKFFSTGEVVPIPTTGNQSPPVTGNQPPPVVDQSPGIRTVGGAVMPTIQRPDSSKNSGIPAGKPGSSLLGFVFDISRALRQGSTG